MKRAIILTLVGLTLVGCSSAAASPGGVAAEDTVAPIPEITTTEPATTVPAASTTTEPAATTTLPPTTTVPPTTLPVATVPPTIAGPDVVGAQGFIDSFVANVQPDLMGICPLVRTQPDMVREAMRGGFDDFAVHEQAARFGYSNDEFVDMLTVAYSNRLVTECI